VSFQLNRKQKNVCYILVRIIVDYADDVNIMGRSVHTIKKNTGSLVVASEEISLDVNAEKVISW
jgi:hypothetical protein